MTKDEALDLALEALENSVDLVIEEADEATKLYSNYETRLPKVRGLAMLATAHQDAITAIKQARALDKKADNARELGLDYEPVQEPVAWMDRDGDLYANEPDKNWCPPHYPLYTTPPAAQPAPDLQAELEATNRQVEILSDALAESRREIAQLKAQPAPLQDVDWKDQYEKQKRRAEMWVAKYEKDIGPLEKAAPAAQRQWVGLTDEDVSDLCGEASSFGTSSWIRHIEAKLRSKNI